MDKHVFLFMHRSVQQHHFLLGGEFVSPGRKITFWIFLKFVSSRIAHFIHRQNINPLIATTLIKKDISEGLQEIGLLIQETIEKELN
ncbi:hypothetical protein ACJX0J_036288, partial [Zea mays]